MVQDRNFLYYNKINRLLNNSFLRLGITFCGVGCPPAARKLFTCWKYPFTC